MTTPGAAGPAAPSSAAPSPLPSSAAPSLLPSSAAPSLPPSDAELDAAGDEAESRERPIEVETEIFILTESVEGLQPDEPDVPFTVEFSDCLTPLDEGGCCWVELTACPSALDHDSADPGDEGAVSDPCKSRQAHGCKG